MPGVAEAFHATPLSLNDWLLVLGVAFAPAIAAEVIRWQGRGNRMWIA